MINQSSVCYLITSVTGRLFITAKKRQANEPKNILEPQQHLIVLKGYALPDKTNESTISVLVQVLRAPASAFHQPVTNQEDEIHNKAYFPKPASPF